jgi:CRP-like cAMP-binding protein
LRRRKTLLVRQGVPHSGLSDHPFAKDLDQSIVEVLARCAKIRRLEVGDYLGREGEPADSVFLISAGQVAVEIAVPLEPPGKLKFSVQVKL